MSIEQAALVQAIKAVVLAFWGLAYPHRSPPEAPTLARDIAMAVVIDDGANTPIRSSHPEDALLVAEYMRLESGVSTRPTPSSWDAHAGRSCGVLQMPCRLVRQTTVREQVAIWLRWAREGTVESLDSSPSRAHVRMAAAHTGLVKILEKRPLEKSTADTQFAVE